MANPEHRGLDRERLQYLKSVMEADIRKKLYFGGVIAVARHGELGLFEAVGHADEAGTRPVRKDSVFSLFSVTKAFTNVAFFRAVERGQLAITTQSGGRDSGVRRPRPREHHVLPPADASVRHAEHLHAQGWHVHRPTGRDDRSHLRERVSHGAAGRRVWIIRRS